MADVTTFYYTIPSLKNRIGLEVLYKTKNRKNITELGNNTIIDADVLIGEYISAISYDIFDKLTSPFGRTLDELEVPLLPFEYNVSYTPPGEISAGSFIVGRVYTILVPGTTDFTLIGASDSEIGTSFTATGTGTGTGTANYSELDECILYRCIWPTKYDIATGTYIPAYFDTSSTPAIEKAMGEVIVSFAVYQWMMDCNIQGWEKYELEHLRKYDTLRGLTTRRIKLTRTYKY
jgi:hypothetical protein